jgi:hypothetical protein
VRQPAPPFEQFRRGLLLARLVFAPREAAIATRLLLLDVPLLLLILLVLVLLLLVLVMLMLRVSAATAGAGAALVRCEARKDKDGLDAQFFERAEVALDARRQAEGQSARGGEEGFARRWDVVEGLEVVGRIDAQARVRKDVERKCLKMLPLLKVSWFWEKENNVLRANPIEGNGYTLSKCLMGIRRLFGCGDF